MTPSEMTLAALARVCRDLDRDRAAMGEQANVVRTLRPLMGSDPSREGRAALALALHHWYTALETALSRVIRLLDGSIPEGADWHRLLIDEASKPLRSIWIPGISVVWPIS